MSKDSKSKVELEIGRLKKKKEKILEKIKPIHARFCEYYIVSLNLSETANDLGITKTNANFILKQDISQRYINVMHLLTQIRVNITKDDLIRDAEDIKLKCMQKKKVRSKKGKHLGTYKFDATGANRAIDTQAKMLGHYSDRRVEITATVDQQTTVTNTARDFDIKRLDKKERLLFMKLYKKGSTEPEQDDSDE